MDFSLVPQNQGNVFDPSCRNQAGEDHVGKSMGPTYCEDMWWSRRLPKVKPLIWNLLPEELVENSRKFVDKPIVGNNIEYFLQREAEIINLFGYSEFYRYAGIDSMNEASQQASGILQEAHMNLRGSQDYYDNIARCGNKSMAEKVSQLVGYDEFHDPNNRARLKDFQAKYMTLIQKYSSPASVTEKSMLKVPLPAGFASSYGKSYATSGSSSLVPSSDYLFIMSNMDDVNVRRICHDQMMKNSYFAQKDDICRSIFRLRHSLAADLGFQDFLSFSLKWKYGNRISKKQLSQLVPKLVGEQNDWDSLYAISTATRPLDSIVRIPIESLVTRLASFVQSVFDLEFKHEKASANGMVWRSNVDLYSVWSKNKDEHLGYVYFDLFSSPGKRRGNSTVCVQKRISGFEQSTPISVVLNSSIPPTKGYQLSVFELSQLMHEVGHTVHELLGRSEPDFPQFNGSSNVERELVEVPSQVVESWAWRPDVIEFFTGRQLSSDTIRLLQSCEKNLYDIMKKQDIKKSAFDIKVHTDPEKIQKTDRGFSMLHHIITDGYDASFFIYLISRLKAEEFIREIGSPFDGRSISFARFMTGSQ